MQSYNIGLSPHQEQLSSVEESNTSLGISGQPLCVTTQHS